MKDLFHQINEEVIKKFKKEDNNINQEKNDDSINQEKNDNAKEKCNIY